MRDPPQRFQKFPKTAIFRQRARNSGGVVLKREPFSDFGPPPPCGTAAPSTVRRFRTTQGANARRLRTSTRAGSYVPTRARPEGGPSNLNGKRPCCSVPVNIDKTPLFIGVQKFPKFPAVQDFKPFLYVAPFVSFVPFYGVGKFGKISRRTFARTGWNKRPQFFPFRSCFPL